jgi:MFS family permease
MDDANHTNEAPRLRSTLKTHRNVFALGTVSLLNDTASEMIYPLLPIFLKSVLGVGAGILGVIEGLAESTAAIMKYFSGRISDRIKKRKALAVSGYLLSNLVRPAIGLAQSAGAVLGFRLADRVGKGVRTAPRDALLADSASAGRQGYAFGIQRAMDHAGAVIGPLIAAGLFAIGISNLRTVFYLSVIPGIATVAVLVFIVREIAPAAQAKTLEVRADARPNAKLPRPFYWYLGTVGLFALGNSTDAFLLLRASDWGIHPAVIPLLWSFHNAAKSAFSVFGGMLSDRISRRGVIIAGWMVYAAVYAGFALADGPAAAWVLFFAYGLYFALTEGVEKALVADFAGSERRGTAYGWYHLAIGITAAPASILFGALWATVGPAAAFFVGAGLAAMAAVALLIIPMPQRV